MAKELEVRVQLTTEQVREAVWEWLNYYQLVNANVEDIAFSEEFVTAHVKGKTWPRNA